MATGWTTACRTSAGLHIGRTCRTDGAGARARAVRLWACITTGAPVSGLPASCALSLLERKLRLRPSGSTAWYIAYSLGRLNRKTHHRKSIFVEVGSTCG